MTTQILNFGLPAQIDVRVVGRDRAANLRVAQELRRRIAGIPGIADAHLQQELDAPAFMVNIDRSRALQLGLNAQAVANDLNISLSSSEQVAPNFWTDPANGIPYYIAVQTPERLMSSLGELGDTPVSTQIAANGPPIPGLLEQCGDDSARQRSNESEPDQHPAGLRHLCQRAGPRSRQRLGRHRQDRRRPAEAAQARQHDTSARSDPEHARIRSGIWASGSCLRPCSSIC